MLFMFIPDQGDSVYFDAADERAAQEEGGRAVPQHPRSTLPRPRYRPHARADDLLVVDEAVVTMTTCDFGDCARAATHNVLTITANHTVGERRPMCGTCSEVYRTMMNTPLGRGRDVLAYAVERRDDGYCPTSLVPRSQCVGCQTRA